MGPRSLTSPEGPSGPPAIPHWLQWSWHPRLSPPVLAQSAVGRASTLSSVGHGSQPGVSVGTAPLGQGQLAAHWPPAGPVWARSCALESIEPGLLGPCDLCTLGLPLKASHAQTSEMLETAGFNVFATGIQQLQVRCCSLRNCLQKVLLTQTN